MDAEQAALRAYYERRDAREVDLDDRMADPADRAAIRDGARVLERVPELAGLGPHLLATAVLPVTG